MTSPNPGLIQRWKHRFRGPITRERVSRYVRSRMQRLFGQPAPAASQTPAPPPLLGPGGVDYSQWIKTRIRARQKEYTATPDPKLFTIITPVYDTPPAFLEELAHSVFAQDFPFQWAISDDGSTNPQTLEVVDRIRQDPRVTFVKLPQNSGITVATRAAFDIATGKYIIPVDADDLIYPDALRVMAACLERAGWPALAYSDEDKIFADSVPVHPFFKPDWDPALFLNCCYIAHLCAISREAATKVQVYSDHQARGCPDLDTFSRLLAAGETPLHVPEVLYSWRIHAGSTASSVAHAKPYAIACQNHVWSNHLARIAPPRRVELRTNPLFGAVGMWYPYRRHVDPLEMQVFVWAEDSPLQLHRCLASLIGESPYPRLNITVLGLLTPEHHHVIQSAAQLLPTRVVKADVCPLGLPAYLRQAVSTLPPQSLAAILSDRVRVLQPDWAWEACGIFDVHADAAACTPRLFGAAGEVASGGEFFGFNGIVGAPDSGRGPQDSGYHGWMFCQRTVSAASSDFFVARGAFLEHTLSQLPTAASRLMLGAWVGAEAARAKQRIVYSPFVVAQLSPSAGMPQQTGYEELFEFLTRHHDLIVSERYYSRFQHLQRGRGFEIALPQERAAAVNAVLSRLEGPRDFLGTLAVSPAEYTPATIVPPRAGTQLKIVRGDEAWSEDTVARSA